MAVADKFQSLKQRALTVELEPALRCAKVAAAFLLALPLISLFHEMTVLVAARALRLASSSPVLEWPIKSLVGDPVYSQIALEMIGNAEAHGIAVSGPIGQLLHAVLPALFDDPNLVIEGAWISAVVASGSSGVSQLLVVASADGLLVFLGVLLVHWGLRGESLPRIALRPANINGLVLFGLLLQARSVIAILTMQFTQATMENLGLAHVGTKLLLNSRQSYEASLLPLTGWLGVGVQILLLIAIYAAALLLARLVFAVPKLRNRQPAPNGSGRASTTGHASRLVYLVPMAALAVLASASPSFGMVATNFGYEDSPTATAIVARDVQAVDSDQSPVDNPEPASPDSSLALPAQPSVVSITGGLHNYLYEVDGSREVIRGVGYNVIYRYLSTEERTQRYEQDFARMREAGINTILGWDADKGFEHDRFDELLLDKAGKYGLGVLMPYYLPANGEYRKAEYRSSVKENVIAWVRRFKDHPAVRMWAIGNEVLHGMSSPANAEAFARFYLELADAVHEEDPNHPVLYRDAEDVYVGPLKDAWVGGDVDRPWLVYGMNVFTFRIGRILTEWRRHAFDVPVVVTEFGPTGLTQEDRPKGLIRMWRVIRNNQCNVLGGVVYVWTTAGPEPIDRVFGLVDENGNAVDGSLDAIAGEYRQDLNLARECGAPTTGPQ